MVIITKMTEVMNLPLKRVRAEDMRRSPHFSEDIVHSTTVTGSTGITQTIIAIDMGIAFCYPDREDSECLMNIDLIYNPISEFFYFSDVPYIVSVHTLSYSVKFLHN